MSFPHVYKNRKYPKNSRIRINTIGSTTNTITNGEARFHVQLSARSIIEKAIKIACDTSNNRAKQEAICEES